MDDSILDGVRVLLVEDSYDSREGIRIIGLADGPAEPTDR